MSLLRVERYVVETDRFNGLADLGKAQRRIEPAGRNEERYRTTGAADE